MGHFKRGRKWQNPVPFRLGPKVASNNALVSRINKAIAEYENQTKVRFVTRTYENEFIIFVAKPKGTSSQAQVGRGGGKNGRTRVWLTSNAQKTVIMHEIGHALGLFHEHQRRDRGGFVTILWKNIKKRKKDQFRMTKGGDGRRVGTYDLSSIMHYRSRQYTKNGKPTILAKSGVALSGSVLTPTDIATVNMLVKERSVRGPGGRQPQSTRTR